VTVSTGVISGASVDIDHATVDELEAATVESQRAGVERLLSVPAVEEAYVLQTCNRAEAYVVADGAETGRAALEAYLAGTGGSTVREFGHEASLRHLMRVACGLESLVVGEDQILGQVRAAYETARGAGAVGPVFEDALLKALHVGERARTETAINEGVVSLGSAAVEMAAAERDLEGATAVVVGAGGDRDRGKRYGHRGRSHHGKRYGHHGRGHHHRGHWHGRYSHRRGWSHHRCGRGGGKCDRDRHHRGWHGRHRSGWGGRSRSIK
jgi:hypothetical protein